ncbi:MAG TPA: hypothetical protein VGQ84_10315 [Gaiellaceae bacterium]|jgi:hypothetical protein|nr:hypothetical protein [Gaiellaceae bacterium]
MIRTLRTLLLFEAATFAVAASIHFGALLDGYEHTKAGRAESVIAVVLLAGFALTWAGPRRARLATIGTQGFAILGVCVGLFTIAVGVGPRTVLDVVYHVAIVAVLAIGLAIALREPAT